MANTYQNPFHLEGQWEGNQLGDPYMMRHNGYTYLYCSSHRMEIKCWRSENLVDWQYLGSVCDLPEINGAYAPEVHYFKGKFYMVTSPVGSGHYLLSADQPEGPFSLISENFGLLIDGTIFVDDDGSEYFLRAGHKGIVIHQMPTPNLPEIKGHTIAETYLNHWTEGPMIIKRKGKYFLTYTGNHLLSRGYRIDYSVSETGPDRGYVNLDNHTLLLEVGDEFHALGHSSSCLGPDTDSYYIAYHSFDFRPERPFRSLNIDRLFFNGARMYTNATWWPEEAPTLPLFSARDGQHLKKAEKDGQTYYSAPATQGPFTAEAVFLSPGGGLFATLGDDLHIELARKTTVSVKGDTLLSKEIPLAVALDAPLTLRVGCIGTTLSLWVNSLYLGDVTLPAAMERATFAAGCLGGDAPSYLSLSPVADGSGDAVAQKSIPGRFDAIHGTTPVEKEVFTEKGMSIYAARCAGDTSLTYRVNVKEKGLYLVVARLRQEADLSFTINGQPMQAMQPDITDEEGYAKVCCGIVSLEEGPGTMTLSHFSTPVSLDHLVFVPHATLPSVSVVAKGQLASKALRILSHKREKSMLRKVYGFTCAENHGMGFIGDDGLTDYTVTTSVNVWDPGAGSASLFLRVTKESWFGAQVGDSLMGYRLLLNHEGLHLYRCDYGQSLLVSLHKNWQEKELIHLSTTVQGSTISVLLNGAPAFSYTDANQFAFGKLGIEVTGEGYGFESFDIK